MYRLIRTAAYEVEPGHGPIVEAHHMMRPDPAWWAELTERYRSARRGDPAYGLPTRHLGSLLCALAPGVVTADAQAASARSDAPWLYARELVPDDVIVPLIDTWATELLAPRHVTTDVPGIAGDEADDEDGFGYWYGNGNGTPENEREDCGPANDQHIEHLLERLYEAPPTWTTEDIDLTSSATSPAGTALPGRHVYRLLTEWVAARLTARPWHVRGRTLRFKAVTDGERSELVSWPPLRHVTHRRAWYYSARLSVHVQTVPFHGHFRVHVSPGIRRWVTGSGTRPGPGQRATVLLDAPLPWADAGERTPRLIGNSVGYDHRLRRLSWQRRSTATLLPHVDIVRTFPDPEELFRSPEELLLGRDSFRAGITYHPTMQGVHRIGPGLMPRERAELDAWVAESLAPAFRRVPDLTRINRVSKPLLGRTVDPDRRGVENSARNPVDVAAAGRRQALHDVLGGQALRLDIVWHSKDVRDEVLHALPELLGLPHPEKTSRDEWTSEAHGLTVRMCAVRRGVLGAPLKLPRRRGLRRATALGQAITARTEQVAGFPATQAHATVIELDGRARYPRAGTDPKHALRIGFAATGRLTQFIQPPGEEAPDLGQRARSACLDVLRQIGAVPFPPHQAGAAIPENLQYVGLWLVRHTSRGPTRCATRRLIALRIRPGDHEPVHGWDEIRETWVPYRRLLLTLASDRGLPEDEPGTRVPGRPDGSAARWHGFENPWREEAQRQIQSILFQIRDRPTLLLASAGNLRQCWPGLASGVLAPDELAFGAGEPGQRLSLYGPDLRFVLLRDANGRGEVPQWWARDEAGAIGFSAGLWTPGHAAGRVFYSTADVPHTAARPKGLMKLVPDADGRTAPTKNAWNPRGLEITVAGCLSAKALADAGREQEQPDDPADWAMLAHQLRFHDSYSPLAWPLPLHLAKLAGEYVLPMAKEGTEAQP
ncbi:DUF3893 domain-containing protein [Streptomyces sp. WAC07149]|uniref:pPIWI_RE module domain-containing protein n=1 Tax=Streptomyces sp. WAC07149 TaxID=2487425 RepID=UPI000F7A439F|nr:DUF3962 domain-containing protein [Streptomyces sp. WAC07149]RST00389.1 DUF3893 domain-containing protein [Streptomyces sp. WAC07149]